MRDLRTFAPLAWVAIGFLACSRPSGGVAADEPARRPPNVIILLADDLGYADVGFHGCPDIPTPNLDEIAGAGVRCTNGYVSGPYCSPTRAGLLTGRYQTRFGHEFNPGGRGASAAGLPVEEVTMADRLKAAGYTTGIVGKWHLGDEPQFHPRRRGFDEFFGFLGGAHSYFEAQPESKNAILRQDRPVESIRYTTDDFAREATAFIDRHGREDRPFFLYLAFNAVHTPMEATDEYLARFPKIEDRKRRTYAAMLSAMDDAIGAVMDRLRATGLEEDTLVFFFSDNGGPTMPGTTTNASRNDPLRGSKRTTLEGGVRVPFLVQWKGTLPAGKTYDRPVIQLDILPTALAAAGVEAKPEWKLDGVDLLPYLKGDDPSAPHEALYWRFGDQMAIRRGDWKLVRYDATVDSQGATSKGTRSKVTPPRLYNLARDIGEANDLASQSPGELEALQDAWDAWDAQLVEPLWGSGKE